MNNSNVLALAVRRFLGDYLPHQRAFSTHTIRSYRDSLKLLLQFAAGSKRRVADLTVGDLMPEKIIAFLDSLEQRRGNDGATRNVRLSAIHSFFDYLGAGWPEHLDQARRVLAITFKRTDHRTIDYLEAEELRTLLEQMDRRTVWGRRDYVLLALMFNTGARVQEVVALQTTDLRLTSPPSVKFFGKGRRERICPLWPETARLLQQHIADTGLDTQSDQTLFRNHRGGPLTRFGARLILQRHVTRAVVVLPALKHKRIHPHSLRHSTAVHLLKSGVDLSTIAHWLGHTSINTTHKYVTIDLAAKRAAIAKAEPVTKSKRLPRWRTDNDLLTWLESL
ncbi:MAG: tyrosine-type recombinase/integrase [Verrucomicrobiota bacterium]